MKEMKRFLSLLLCFVLLLGVLPFNALAEGIVPDSSEVVSEDPTQVNAEGPSEEPSANDDTAIPLGLEDEEQAKNTVYVLAGSDFQADTHTASAENVSSILKQIKNVYGTMNGFLFAGDYDVDDVNSKNNDSAGGKTKLQETVQSVYGTEMDEVYVQGNHDKDNLVGSTLSASGENDAEDYGVFVINEKDYMWYNDDESTIKNTAADLESYLNNKLNDKYSKPIFVISHLPLHYSMRTREGGGDGMYANYIFDVLNKAGNAGLNIIFLAGHDHSHGWDDYLGGAAIFLTKGDKINIAQSSKTDFKEETLAFTYMNAGYVGYYGTSYTSDVDKALTMTTFAITDTKVTITRYDSKGTHNLKSAGVYNVEYPDSGYYKTNTDVVESSYTLKLNKFEPDPVVEDKTTGVTVSAPGISGVTVTVKNVEVPKGYTAYVSYDIELEGYTDGDTATVTIAVPKGFDKTKSAVVLYAGEQIAKDTDLSDGITFTTTHFSEYDVAQVDESYGVTASGNLASDTTVNTTAVTGNLQVGYYLIRPVRDGNGTLTNVSAKVNDSTGLDVAENSGLNIQNNNLWYYDGTHIRFGGPTGQYLTVGSTKDAAALTKDANATNLVNSVYENTNYRGTYTLAATSNATYKYLNRAGSGSFAGAWSSDGNGDEGSRWRFYEVTIGTGDPVTLTVTPASKTITNGKTANLTASVLVNNKTATSKTINWVSSDPTVATVDANGVVTGVKDGTATITATLTKANGQNVNGTVKVEIPVTVKTRTATSIAVDSMTGSVQRGAKDTAETGSTITVTYNDGSTETVPVTVSMLTNADGSAVSTKTVGSYENLTVTYEGQPATNYTLNVVAKLGNNYPEYPNEGAVKVNKTATGIDFQSSGIAQVEVSASGVPVQRGADVVIVIDTSSSMDKDVDGQTPSNGEKSRIDILSESLEKVLKIFQTPDDNGNIPDIDIAVIDFNGYGDRITGATLNGGYRDDANQAAVYTGTTDGNWKLISNVGLSANNFVDVTTLNAANFAAMFDEDRTSGGTNYDSGLENAYKLLQYKQEANGEEERDQYVIFLSDGTSNRYNGYENSANSAYDNWDKWLSGYWVDQDAMTSAIGTDGKNAYPYFYNGNGTNHPHRTAEAIKGDPTENYDVIDRSADDANPKYIAQIPGLGATIYSIGFGLADDGGDYGTIKETTVENVLKTISSGEGYYQFVKSADALDNAFAQITSEIIYAASNARYVDQMGANYNLQLKTSTYTVVENGATAEKTLAPKIEIISYDIYTRQDYLNGTITADKIGDRKGTSTVLETVTFNADGTEAYSNLIGDGKQNILTGGVIYANTFWYNTKPTDVTIDGVSIPTGKDSADLTTGSTNVLPSETFYWKMGTVQTSELAMRYYVYLEGSMEGTREAGSYPTNNYATLYYDNYLENPCYKDTVSPVMAWKEANVSYAFYLVNEAGEIIVNQTTGETGSFANKIGVTNPIVYETIKLNNLDEISSIEVASNKDGLLPVGYELYDTASVYTIHINSNSTGSWTIVKGDDKVSSTYVTQFDKNDASAYSNDLLNGVDEDGNTVVTGNDYTHTVVWFAVVWKVQALPDTVVIDYGLPVDISVLTNDMFGENGKLAGVGKEVPTTEVENEDGTTVTTEVIKTDDMAAGFGATYSGNYGTAQADISTGKVRYTPTNMQMNGYEKFAYAVNYTGNENAGYYYDTVTVIPATTIYYEDNFVEFDNLTWKLKEGGQSWEGEWAVVEDPEAPIWIQDGKTISDATQAEDRPGFYSLTDANNIYGYDGTYSSCSTYSLGSAMMATVDYDNGAQASFTFYGTGFDVISMTNSTTGTILVDVYPVNTDGTLGTAVRTLTVDTYYGYKQTDCHVVYTLRNSKWVMTDVLHAQTSCSEKCTEKIVTSLPNTGTEEGQEVHMIANAWIKDPSDNNTLWQVPVMEVEGLPYGKYKAVIQAVYDPALDHVSASYEGNYDFYLDAIRIYDPANDGASDGSEDTTIEDAYKADGEGWPSYIELRNKLINANTLGNASTDTEITGMVFIDGDDEVGDAQMKDYISFGPNNEVYLAPGQSVAFLLSTPANIANVHIGIRSADGQTGTYTITNIAQAANSETGVKEGAYYGAKTYTISTTTDMYYDLTGWKGDIIVITNTGNRYDTSGIISLTNIKSTYTSDPSTNNTPAPASELQTRIYMTPAAAALTLRSLNAPAVDETPDEIVPEETIPEETVPEETIPEETVPEETVPEETVPEETVPEETVPEETVPEESVPERDPVSSVTEVITTIIKVISNLFGRLFG